MARMGRTFARKHVFGALALAIQLTMTASHASSQTIPESIAALQAQSEEYLSNIEVSSVEDIEDYLVDFERLISVNAEVYQDIEEQITVLLERSESELQGLEGAVAGAGPSFRELQFQIQSLREQRADISTAIARLYSFQAEAAERREQIQLLVQASQIQEALEVVQETANRLEDLTDSLNAFSQQELNQLQIDIPDALDCPGPGCPLAS